MYSGILIGLACAGSLAFAQESFTAVYDSSRQVTGPWSVTCRLES